MADAKQTKHKGSDTLSPLRNFRLDVEDRVRAAVTGPPAYMRRLRRIEDLEAAIVRALRVLDLQASVRHGEDLAARDAEVLDRAPRGDLTKLNDLIERHNRWYPMEANLPIDLKTGLLVERGAPWRPMPRATFETLLAKMRG